MKTKNKLEASFGQIEKSNWLEMAQQWERELPWRQYAQCIALAILEHLEAKGISQKQFAAMMLVSPQLVNKWLKGNENFTLETISKMEFVLGISLLHFEQQENTLRSNNSMQHH
jgi:ribosome-binding protein aMBF1 (putative translation factor)